MTTVLDFNEIKVAVNNQFQYMLDNGSGLYSTDINPDTIWETYLSSFPEGTDPIYRTRTEHDCSCCRSFIKKLGGVVTIIDNKIVTIWDFTLYTAYGVVVNALSDLVKTGKPLYPFLSPERAIGIDSNHEKLDSGEVLTWNHFHQELPSHLHTEDIPSKNGSFRESLGVIKRTLEEISLESIQIVLDLIDQGSLYRGVDYRTQVKNLFDWKVQYDNADNKEFYLLDLVRNLGVTVRVRNTVIGTLLVDISEDMDLDTAVGRYESKVAPQNYKRTNAIYSKAQIERLEKFVAEEGIEQSLYRRHATMDDITINNVIFADRSTKKSMGVFDEMKKEVKSSNIPDLTKIETVSLQSFISDILPKVDSMEIFFDSKNTGNLVSLIAPEYADSPNILQWSNNFSWSYTGSVTDSIAERVKQAGGEIDAFFRASLSWFNYDDLDLYLKYTGKRGSDHVCYSSKSGGASNCQLDVDMNVSATTRSAVENIFCKSKMDLPDGSYQVGVHNFTHRETIDVGFEVEVDLGGNTQTLIYDKEVKNGQRVPVISFKYSKDSGFTVLDQLPSTTRSKEYWNIHTQKFHPVKMVMRSPNYWDENSKGNPHTFFMINDCKNPDSIRGLYNEFLDTKYSTGEFRKVFDALGNKLLVNPDTEQLSGLGFSDTKKDTVILKLTGSFNRIIKLEI